MIIKEILDNWWQFIIVLAFLTFTFWIISRSIESTIEKIGSFIKVFIGEITLQSPAICGAVINLILMIFAFIISILLVTPSILAQLGLIEQGSDIGKILIGSILFLLTLFISIYFIDRFIHEQEAFTNIPQKRKNK